MIQKVKNRIYEILHGVPTEDAHVRVFHVFIITLIFLNVFAVILETVESLSSRYIIFFKAFEVFSVFIFTIEYLLLLWTC
ncbi:MAG: voltage-gated potassium channel, partial [Planctomycetota bacterium]|nr:voltage-gated potassium channel [Planctomycetota bacterium]